MMDDTLSQFGRVDILVNHLNLEFGKPFLKSPRRSGRVIDANLTSAFLCSKAVGKHMVEQKAGKIINIVSGAAEEDCQTVQPTVRAWGVVQLTRALALEWPGQM
jgi:NAD(P)-dependent dehydrogenase (short-subunit alcohol dehydrogenase family)